MAEANVKPKKKPFFARMKKYFKDTKSELKKVTWPSKEQLKKKNEEVEALQKECKKLREALGKKSLKSLL